MHGCQDAPMGTRLWEERIVGVTFLLDEPLAEVDVVDAQFLESLGVEVESRDLFLFEKLCVFGHVFGTNLFLAGK